MTDSNLIDHDVILNQTLAHVKQTFEGEGTGHDWWHIQRVLNTAVTIGAQEGADLYIVQLGALLHDIADWKFHGGDDTLGPRVAREWLEGLGADAATIDQVVDIVNSVTFKGAGEASKAHTLEARVVQDADRLDAMGAIGIARAFAYGGYKGREIYNPTIAPVLNQTVTQYKNNNAPSINHFYEKLLLLKDLMNTETARAMAAERHRFMEQYLEQFYQEWEGKA